MSLADRKPVRLTNQKFHGVQSRESSTPFGGPDDVYYDARSCSLLFSDIAADYGLSVVILRLSDLKARRLIVPNADHTAWVTLCGSLCKPGKPVLYLATDLRVARG